MGTTESAESAERTAMSLDEAKDEAERRFLVGRLQKANGRVIDLARNLGLNRSYIQSLLKKHGLTRKLHDTGRQPGASARQDAPPGNPASTDALIGLLLRPCIRAAGSAVNDAALPVASS